MTPDNLAASHFRRLLLFEEPLENMESDGIVRHMSAVNLKSFDYRQVTVIYQLSVIWLLINDI